MLLDGHSMRGGSEFTMCTEAMLKGTVHPTGITASVLSCYATTKQNIYSLHSSLLSELAESEDHREGLVI